MLKAFLLQMLKDFSLRRIFDQTYYTIKENVKNGIPIIDVYARAPPNVVTACPQGSILGPLLLLIYVNDFCRCTTKGETIMFAEDTS